MTKLKLKNKKLVIAIIFLIYAILIMGREFTIGETVFLLYLPLAIVLKIDSRIYFGVGLAWLIFTAFLNTYNQEDLANTIAIYTLYALVLGTLRALNEAKESSNKKDEPTMKWVKVKPYKGLPKTERYIRKPLN